MLAAYELGIFAHGRLQNRADDSIGGSADEGFILSGMLGLLALLMAFTFSMSLNRFENRRELMLREANAISSFSLMTEAAQQPYSLELQMRLKLYAVERLAVSNASGENEKTKAMSVAAALRAPLQRAVRVAMQAHQGSPTAVALGQSYNAMDDAAAERDHLPERVLALLASYCIVSAWMLGYAVASVRSRHRVASATLFVLLSLAFGTILDLDRPRGGSITVSQQPFEAAVRGL